MILDTFLIPDLMIPVSLLTVGSLGVHQLPIIPAYSKHFCPLPKVWGICVPFSDTVPNIFSAKWILNLKVSQILQYDSVYVSLEEIEIIASLFPYGFDTEQNFLCVIDTNIGVSNSSQRGSGDFLELSRKCDSSVIDELLQPDLRPILDLVLPFMPTWITAHTPSRCEAPKAQSVHVAKHTGLRWNILNLLNRQTAQHGQ